MRSSRSRRAWLPPALLTFAVALVPLDGIAQPRIQNAEVRTIAAGGGLADALRGLSRSPSPSWAGFGVPLVEGRHRLCCMQGVDDRGCCGPCALESRRGSVTINERSGEPIPLEGSRTLLVLFRMSGGQVETIRSFSGDCELDGGGLPFHWLTGVTPAESRRWLGSFVADAAADENDTKLAKGALGALAFHAGPEADADLERFMAPGRPGWLRKQVAFWLGHVRGQRGFDIVRRAAATDADAAFRRQAAFALSGGPVDQRTEALMELATKDASASVRSEALFWLAQCGDSRADAAILRSIENDPDRSVQKKGVFALSQLPDQRGTASLVGLARRHERSEVRGEALFWLAQKAGKAASAAIVEAVSQDPEEDVKKKAVFALSQLPPDQGVPLLIDIARTHASAGVRKQAMFWLGQSKDPRAIAFFEEILLKK